MQPAAKYLSRAGHRFIPDREPKFFDGEARFPVLPDPAVDKLFCAQVFPVFSVCFDLNPGGIVPGAQRARRIIDAKI